MSNKHGRGIKRRLPTGRAWNGKNQQAIIDGIAEEFELQETNVKAIANIDNILFNDNLASWQKTLGLIAAGTAQQQKDDVVRKLSDIGGLRAEDIQAELQSAGFDLYVHKNSFTPESGLVYTSGDEDAFAGLAQHVNPKEVDVIDPRNYINGVPYIACGDDIAFCGHEDAITSGIDYPSEFIINSMDQDRDNELISNIIIDYVSWKYVFFIGGETFPEQGDVALDRKEELRRLILEIKPLPMWVILFANYV